MQTFRIVLSVVLAVALVGASAPAFAEGFISGRFGGSFTDDGDLEVEDTVKLDVEFKDSVTFGLRGGYWIDAFDYLGVALDFSYFRSDLDKIEDFDLGGFNGIELDADVHIVPISFLALARLPLMRSDSHPHGVLQPYVGIGPGLFLTVADADTNVPGSDEFAAVGADVGLDFKTGLNLQITELIAIFAEYRFTHYKAKLNDDIDVAGDIDLDLDLDTHHITAGVGFHF